MILRRKDEFVDELGDDWLLESEIDTAAGVRTYITTPTGVRRELRPKTPVAPRPSVDSETPLPLDFQ